MINPHTGQVLTPGTPEYDAFMKGAAPELNALGVATSDYLKGGVGAQLMNNPLTSAYSTAFAQNNTTPGGGQAFAQSNGGIIGYGKNNGYVDASGNSTGLGSELSGGLNPNFAAQIGSKGYSAPSMPQPQAYQNQQQTIPQQSSQLGFTYSQPRYQPQYQPQYMSQPAQYGQPRYQQSQMMPYYRQNIGNNMGFPQTTANSTSSQFSGLNGRGLL